MNIFLIELTSSKSSYSKINNIMRQREVESNILKKIAFILWEFFWVQLSPTRTIVVVLVRVILMV